MLQSRSKQSLVVSDTTDTFISLFLLNITDLSSDLNNPVEENKRSKKSEELFAKRKIQETFRTLKVLFLVTPHCWQNSWFSRLQVATHLHVRHVRPAAGAGTASAGAGAGVGATSHQQQEPILRCKVFHLSVKRQCGLCVMKRCVRIKCRAE